MDAPIRFEDPRSVLRRHGLGPKRSWGQNFLISEGAVRAIAGAAVDAPGRRVLEIGAGLGTLTGALLSAGGCVTAIERDREMCAVLKEEFGGMERFVLVEADAASFDYAGYLGTEKAVIAGNLPYQLTGRLLRTILVESGRCLRIVVMVQEEVAERMAAVPGGKSRGALSVFCQVRWRARVLRRLSPTAFFPRPKVRSAVVALDPLEETVFDKGVEPADFERVVRAAFSSRRKTLRNALSFGGLGSAEAAEALLREAGIDPGLRPGDLGLDDFAALSRALGAASSWQGQGDALGLKG